MVDQWLEDTLAEQIAVIPWLEHVKVSVRKLQLLLKDEGIERHANYK